VKSRSLVRFGSPILREQSKFLTTSEIKSDSIRQFIDELKASIESKQYGVGLAAPQVGKNLCIAIIDIKPTALRPNVEKFSMIVINPTYQGIGRRRSLWEGCLSSGTGKNTLYAKALRYTKIHATWHDEHGKLHKKILTELQAHVFQHETDHLNGVLFVDRVRDTQTYMMADEYKKRIAKKQT